MNFAKSPIVVSIEPAATRTLERRHAPRFARVGRKLRAPLQVVRVMPSRAKMASVSESDVEAEPLGPGSLLDGELQQTEALARIAVA